MAAEHPSPAGVRRQTTYSRLGQVPFGERSAEHRRLVASQDRAADWKHWGPYVSERSWGTVREVRLRAARGCVLLFWWMVKPPAALARGSPAMFVRRACA